MSENVKPGFPWPLAVVVVGLLLSTLWIALAIAGAAYGVWHMVP